MGNGASPDGSLDAHTEEQPLGAPPDKGAQRLLSEKVSDEELVRRRQEVKTLKEQIYGSRPHAGDFRNSLSPTASSSRPARSPPSVPRSKGRATGSPCKVPKSPRSASGDAQSVAGLQSPEGAPAMPYARRGHFDASTLPTHFDSYEVENLRAKLGEMEAKLLNTQSQLVKEREASRTAKARLAMELQTRMSSAEKDFVHSKTGLETQLDGLQESFQAAKAALDSEKKERQLREVEIERLQRAITNMSLNQSTQQSVLSGDASSVDTDWMPVPNSAPSSAEIQKIQDLCQVNLALLGQKRAAVKHVVAMNSEIAEISAMMQEIIGHMHTSAAMGLADEMLATENKTLLMAQLQMHSKLQFTESELQSCQEELKHAKMQLSELQKHFAQEDKRTISRRATRSAAPPPSQQQQQQQQEQGTPIADTFPLVSEQGDVFVVDGRSDEMDALKKSCEACAEWAGRLQKSEEQVHLLRSMLEQEHARSSAQLADLQEELNSVHQSRMSESMRFSGAGFTSQQCAEGISMKLDMKLNDIENSVEFVQAVKLDLCSALGISAARIQMHGLRAGSVIVDMAVQEGVNQSDRTPGEILMELLRQTKDPSSELMSGCMTSKIISIEIYCNDRTYQENIKSDVNRNDTSSAVDESTRSTSNWIELVEQQTVQLKRQTADIVELEHLNRRLTTELEEKEGAVVIIRQALDTREAEVDALKSSNRQLEDQLHHTQADASNWKRAFDNLEAQLNQHNELIKTHLLAAEGRADGLQREKALLAAELNDMTEKYLRASQDSVRSVESFDSGTIIPEVATVATRPNITRGAPPPVQARTSPSPTRYLSPSAGMSSEQPTTKSDADQDSSMRVDMSLKLSLQFEAVGKEGSLERSAFEKQLKEDLARSSGLPTGCFNVKHLAPGSILVDLSIQPHPSVSGPSPLEVALQLQKQAHDPASRLKNGALTRHMAEVTVHLAENQEYKMIREENQRLREQVQNLRAQVLKGEAEIEFRSSKINDLQKELEGHLSLSKQLQAQIDSSISQLNKVQSDNAELALRFQEAEARAKKAIQEKDACLVELQEVKGPKNVGIEAGSIVGKLQLRNEELETRLREAEEQLNKVANVLEERHQQEQQLTFKHDELARAFDQEKLEKEKIQKECQSSQAGIEKLKVQLAQERSETEDLIAKMSKVTHEKEEALQRMRDAESHVLRSSGEIMNDLAVRLQEERTEKEAANTKFREANQQIHNLQVQGVQLAQAKIFLEEKLARLTEVYNKEKEQNIRELNESRQRAAELETLCAASSQREKELMQKNRAQSVMVQELEMAMEKTDGDHSDRRRGDEIRDKSIANLEMRLEGLRMELHTRDKQISKLQEALSSTRLKMKNTAPGNSSPQDSTRSLSYESPRFTGDDQDAGKIQPFYEGFSHPESTQDGIEMRIAIPAPAKAQRSAAHALPVSQKSYSPVSSPSNSPLDTVPGSILGYTPTGPPGSTHASRGSVLSPTESLESNRFRESMGHTDLMLALSPQPSRATAPDVKPTFPASTQHSFFQSKPTYQGELKDGWPNGRGITVWPDGRVYDGYWRQGVFQGNGTCVWSNGDTYEGEWEEGFAHGLGMYTYSNGDVFEGAFKQDKFHGHGALSSAQGVKYRGCWDHGDLMGWTLVIGKNGDKIKQYFDKGIPVENPGVPDDLYGSTLLAVSEVVKTVREQTAQIRQARAAVPESSPVRWDPSQRTVSNATPKQAMVRSVVGASPVEVRPGEQEAMAASLAGSNRSRHMTTASAHGSTQRTPGQDRARNPNSVVLTRQESTKIFYELDADGNGEVSQIEYIKALRKNPNLAQRLGLPSQIRQEEDARYLFAYMFGEMDKDQSKSISLQEFVEYYSGHRTEARSEFLDASLTPSLQRNATIPVEMTGTLVGGASPLPHESGVNWRKGSPWKRSAQSELPL